jgi:hypothetical protein
MAGESVSPSLLFWWLRSWLRSPLGRREVAWNREGAAGPRAVEMSEVSLARIAVDGSDGVPGEIGQYGR